MPATLYLETYGLSLKKTSGMLRIARDQETLQEISALKVASVVVAAEGVNLSGGAVRVCMENNIPIFFFPDLKGKKAAEDHGRAEKHEAHRGPAADAGPCFQCRGSGCDSLLEGGQVPGSGVHEFPGPGEAGGD